MARPRETRGVSAVFDDCVTPEMEAFQRATMSAPLSRSCTVKESR